jgi:hypothetical protein
MILQLAGLPIHLFKLGSVIVALYVPWLIVLPLFGAVGAYLSRCAGGDRLTRLAAGLFPGVAFFGLFCVLFAGSLIVGHASVVLIGVGLLVCALHGVALLLGALPFLRAPKLLES